MKEDWKLKQDIEEELEWTPGVDAAHIGVEVAHGIVTLCGYTSSLAEKLAAEEAARRVSGVCAVVVEMDVRVPHHDVRYDSDIASAANTLLRWTVGLPEGAVSVQVEHGHVTLGGAVEWAYQSRMAVSGIAHLRGVSGVTNQIRVQNDLASADVGEAISRALQRHAIREAQHIDVKVEDGTVTLSGTVESMAERNAARGAAWGTRGVNAVVDNLRFG
ncbi:BON domain-containing protein [Caballeronia sp. BR00000012568055]|uniref:BON domain-containing protein n=1 Tax=Caballeronia sp. BR00000012568055 TaxID=2918761 RepID=UPI0023FA4275|nr:BON domain-containing protein [Caballeronia sp. BR00000012568055]